MPNAQTRTTPKSHRVRLAFELEAARARFARELTTETRADLDDAARALAAEIGTGSDEPSFAEAQAAIEALAPGKTCSLHVEAWKNVYLSGQPDGRRIVWSASIHWGASGVGDLTQCSAPTPTSLFRRMEVAVAERTASMVAEDVIAPTSLAEGSEGAS